ncbi:class I SAM-dependent methyltransferase [Capillimicrobium parvum]|uniref:2-methoxy-6-polyprenyl-1,4-benzoquinol methylase, mitochondrial n=1 Tax=Capillimicrobium parvum TaxID=2884022 RepID=A0A9E6Y2D1_9ACTN|nr:class I SAM-dependent methyltransferase [Capillimicrobium parvum]UGS38740.1 2-methoxy-6-polyprenyl-1,4-benzoquinol methylase, mitochondrial [Capillimicrobium parvum]
MTRAQRIASKVFRFGIVPRAKQRAGRAYMDVRARRGGPAPEIRSASGDHNAVDDYWTGHLVNAAPFLTARQSERYLEWRFREYPLFREFSGLYGAHDGEAILDYGCGPGNDVTGFAIHTGARRIVGADVSASALALARHRLSLHGAGPDRVDLVRLTDDRTALPFADGEFDFVSSQGVLHHASDPRAILRELHRVLRPGGEGSIMVYNRDSVWFHLHVAWEVLIRDGRWPGQTADEAFHRTTDGEDCPIANCYRGEEFVALLEEAGFEARYAGGYLSQWELRAMQESWGFAITDERLAPEHREFLRGLRYDYGHRPMHGDLHAGIGGTYRIRRPG